MSRDHAYDNMPCPAHNFFIKVIHGKEPRPMNYNTAYKFCYL